jgi:hypothetical protein
LDEKLSAFPVFFGKTTPCKVAKAGAHSLGTEKVKKVTSGDEIARKSARPMADQVVGKMISKPLES